MRALRSLTLIAAIALAAPAFAEDAAPAAVPSDPALTGMCGKPTGKVADIQKRVTETEKLAETNHNDIYVTYQDPSDLTTYTFTKEGHTAHPAVLCRKPEKQGETMVLHMDVVCEGENQPCLKFRKDFERFNADMQAEIEKKAAAGPGPRR